MKSLPIVLSLDAARQLDELVLYIAKDSFPNALAWEARITATLHALEDMHGHAIDEDASDRVHQQVRKTVFERTYLIHYRVTETTVEIVNIRHGARLPREGEP